MDNWQWIPLEPQNCLAVSILEQGFPNLAILRLVGFMLAEEYWGLKSTSPKVAWF